MGQDDRVEYIRSERNKISARKFARISKKVIDKEKEE
jgi:hypothetical protein